MQVAISFGTNLLVIDPRNTSKYPNQFVTTCVVRLLQGPKTTYAGVAVLNDNDRNDDRIAKAVSLGRAIWQIFPDFSWKQVYGMARFTLWNIELDIKTTGTILQLTEEAVSV
jgi:hypothetical protein